MNKKPLPKDKNIYETKCPILYAMDVMEQKLVGQALPDKG